MATLASGLNFVTVSYGNLYFLKYKSSPDVKRSPLFVLKITDCLGSVRQPYISIPFNSPGGVELRGTGLGGGELMRSTPKERLTNKFSYFGLIVDFKDLCHAIDNGWYGTLQKPNT